SDLEDRLSGRDVDLRLLRRADRQDGLADGLLLLRRQAIVDGQAVFLVLEDDARAVRRNRRELALEGGGQRPRPAAVDLAGRREPDLGTVAAGNRQQQRGEQQVQFLDRT